MTSAADSEVLACGGEMGALMRSLDWSRTSMGPVEAWPTSLRTVVGIVLTSQQPMLVWWGPELIQLYNDAYRHLLGAKHPAAMGQGGRECWREEWDVVEPMIEQVLAGGSCSVEDVVHVVPRKGLREERHFHCAYNPVRDESGSVAGVLVSYWESTGRIIGQRADLVVRGDDNADMRGYLQRILVGKGCAAHVAANGDDALQRELARAHADVARAQARLRAQLMQAPVPVAIIGGPDHVFELANPLYLEMTGRDDDIVGKPMCVAFPELPLDAAVFRMLDDVAESGTPFIADEYAVPIDKKGTGVAEERFFKLTCQPIRDAAGASCGIIMVAVDVTAQVLARQRIEALVEELKAADQRKDEFLATLAHELRNPMAAISMSLAMLERSKNDEDKAQRHRDIAKRQMRNLVRLVDDLLDVSRITRGKIELQEERLDLASVVDNAVAATRPLFEARGHELLVTASPNACWTVGDPARLEQVITNLLTNAAKYTEPGGAVVVRLCREDVGGEERGVLRVRDSGRGIAPDMLDAIFEMFTQAEQTLDRSSGGLGLGLTLVKRLVELHGGTVRAESEGIGKGSELIVTLPLVDVLVRGPAEPSASRKARSASNRQRAPSVPRQRILVVEDADDVRESLRDFLEDLGHDVTVAASGRDGLCKLLALRPDLAFVDVGLPEMDGYEVARRARSALGGHALYLVALTGYGGPEARSTVVAAGFDLHVTKPVEVEELPEIVRRARALVGSGV